VPRLWPALKRTAAEFKDDNLTDWAAALTYYGLLSLFPGLIALVSIVGLVGLGLRRRLYPRFQRDL
jgi:membrane protein